MHKVTGIGGFFFRARDSDALDRWYSENLGIDPVPTTYDAEVWRQEAGETVFTAMPGAMDQFDAPGKVWGINFRVSDLDGMVRPRGQPHPAVAAARFVRSPGRAA